MATISNAPVESQGAGNDLSLPPEGERIATDFDPAIEVHVNFKWTEALTREFIQIRIAKNSIFTGRRNSSITGWNVILEQMGINGMVTPEQARKRWTNMCQKYKELRASIQEKSSLGDGNIVPPSWPFYADIDSYFRLMEHSQPSVSIQDTGCRQSQFANSNEINSRLPVKQIGSGNVGTAPIGTKRKREDMLDVDIPSLQINSQGSSTQNIDSDDRVIELLQRSLDSIQSLQETLKSQGEALIGLLTELVQKN